MDHATHISVRLKKYAATLATAHARHSDDHALEEWLGFWDDDNSVFANVRNLEHWLAQAARQSARSKSAPVYRYTSLTL